MDENRSVEVEVRYRSHDIWIYALTRYFGFTQVWYFFIAFTIYGLFLTFILLKGNPGMFHILETLVTAILSVIIFGLITSYLSSYSGWAKRNRPFTFVFQPELVKLFSEKANSYMQWNYFVKAHETALRFRLYTHNKDQ